jgi:acetoin utilization deacetylase AcuC-like enzyme
MKRLGILHDDRFKLHDTGAGHPETASRIDAVGAGLEQSDVLPAVTRIEPEPIDLALLEARHDRDYIERFRRACEAGERIIDVPDSAICPESYEIALLAAGGTVAAARRVATGEIDRAFCAVRPPGHHAERNRSMGFCMFNNVALAADVVRGECGLERILILDWDVHHGNGTQHAFYADPSVLYISLHGHPHYLYPGTGFSEELGHGDARGTTLNIPFLPGASDEDYREAFEARVVPAVRSFEPRMIILSAGFDAHRDDPVGNVSLSDGMFAEMLGQVLELAERHAQGRVLSVLEGGYNLEVLRRCVCAHVELLADSLGGTPAGLDRVGRI